MLKERERERGMKTGIRVRVYVCVQYLRLHHLVAMGTAMVTTMVGVARGRPLVVLVVVAPLQLPSLQHQRNKHKGQSQLAAKFPWQQQMSGIGGAYVHIS